MREDWFLCLKLSSLSFRPILSLLLGTRHRQDTLFWKLRGASLDREERGPRGLAGVPEVGAPQASGGTLEGLHSEGPAAATTTGKSWAGLKPAFPLISLRAPGAAWTGRGGVLGSGPRGWLRSFRGTDCSLCRSG